MKTIQVVIDEPTLRAADRAASRAKINRSDLVRRALRDYVRRQQVAEIERRHRAAYEATPVRPGEFDVWDRLAAWPEE